MNGIYCSTICRTFSLVQKKDIRLNLFARPKYCFMSKCKSQTIEKPICCDWAIDHVQTCTHSIHSSILTIFSCLTFGLISMGWHYYLADITKGHWHLNTENRILVTGDCHRWIALLNNTISRKGFFCFFSGLENMDLTRLESIATAASDQSDERRELLRISLEGKRYRGQVFMLWCMVPLSIHH